MYELSSLALQCPLQSRALFAILWAALDLSLRFLHRTTRHSSLSRPDSPRSCSHQSCIDWSSDGWGHATPSSDRMFHHSCSVYEQETKRWSQISTVRSEVASRACFKSMALSMIGSAVATFKPQPEKDFHVEPAFPNELLYTNLDFIDLMWRETAPATIQSFRLSTAAEQFFGFSNQQCL